MAGRSLSDRNSPPAQPGVGAARRKSAAFRAREQALARRPRTLRWIAATAVVTASVVAVVVAVAKGNNGSSRAGAAGTSSASAQARATATIGPEGVALEDGSPLASARGAAAGATIDGVQCNSMEEAVYHIHAHLGVYVGGAMRPVPAGIGVVAPVAQQSAHGSSTTRRAATTGCTRTPRTA